MKLNPTQILTGLMYGFQRQAMVWEFDLQIRSPTR